MIKNGGITVILGKYFVTAHAMERYDERVKNRGSILREIRKDLRTLNIKNIVYNADSIHVFTKNSKEFIFAKTPKGLYLKTIIKRNVDDTKRVLDKRKNLVHS